MWGCCAEKNQPGIFIWLRKIYNTSIIIIFQKKREKELKIKQLTMRMVRPEHEGQGVCRTGRIRGDEGRWDAKPDCTVCSSPLYRTGGSVAMVMQYFSRIAHIDLQRRQRPSRSEKKCVCVCVCGDYVTGEVRREGLRAWVESPDNDKYPSTPSQVPTAVVLTRFPLKKKKKKDAACSYWVSTCESALLLMQTCWHMNTHRLCLSRQRWIRKALRGQRLFKGKHPALTRINTGFLVFLTI